MYLIIGTKKLNNREQFYISSNIPPIKPEDENIIIDLSEIILGLVLEFNEINNFNLQYYGMDDVIMAWNEPIFNIPTGKIILYKPEIIKDYGNIIEYIDGKIKNNEYIWNK